MAKIKIKPQRSYPPAPALGNTMPKDLDGVKKQIAQMVLMHNAIKGKQMKKGALFPK